MDKFKTSAVADEHTSKCSSVPVTLVISLQCGGCEIQAKMLWKADRSEKQIALENRLRINTSQSSEINVTNTS
jgi:hypothetical protein